MAVSPTSRCTDIPKNNHCTNILLLPTILLCTSQRHDSSLIIMCVMRLLHSGRAQQPGVVSSCLGRLVVPTDCWVIKFFATGVILALIPNVSVDMRVWPRAAQMQTAAFPLAFHWGGNTNALPLLTSAFFHNGDAPSSPRPQHKVQILSPGNLRSSQSGPRSLLSSCHWVNWSFTSAPLPPRRLKGQKPSKASHDSLYDSADEYS